MRALIMWTVTLAVGTASASPFGPLWTQAVKCPGPASDWVTSQPRTPIVLTGAGTYPITLKIEESVQDGE
jgi:hypothetical protein